MIYQEASYFDGFHFSHIAAWEEHLRLERKKRDARLLLRTRRVALL